ncbi:MAG: replication factor C small subunit [Candidatus Micrarchaeota archaeon]
MAGFVPWIEKYRPHRLDEVVGNEPVVRQLKSFAKNGNPPHLLFAGPAGSGKTSCALALAAELFGDSTSQCLLELNASDERGIDVVRTKIKDFARTLPLSDVPFKAIFLDEADALTQDAQQALRRTMEKYSGNTRFILSCNYSSRIIEPIQSRCAVFRFTRLSEEEVRKIVRNITQAEKIAADEKAVDALVYVSDGDARKAINALQGAASVSEKVTADEIFRVASRARPQEVEKMIRHALDGDFNAARKMLDEIMLRYGMSGEEVILQVFREVTGMALPDKDKVALVDRIGEYDFRIVEGANERIQLEALLAQIMLHGKKKD